MKEKLEQIKAACREAIALGEKATEGPWVWRKGRTQMHLHSCGRPDAGCFSQITMPIPSLQKESREAYEANAAFIAHARTFSPEAAKALLVAIEALDEIEGMPAYAALTQICANWPDQPLS